MWPFSKSKDKKNKPPGQAENVQGRKVQRFDAVEIIPANYGACNAVRALAGQRFLSSRIPKLPLPECGKSECDCGYRQHKDRRASPRRVADMGGAVLSLTQSDGDRRDSSSGGRRRTDKSPRR